MDHLYDGGRSRVRLDLVDPAGQERQTLPFSNDRDKGGVTRYDGKTFTAYTPEDGFADYEVEATLQDDQGRLWFCTATGGVSRYDPGSTGNTTGHGWTNFTTEDGLASNRLTSVIQDREGNIWFGTDGGSTRFDEHTWTTFGEKRRSREQPRSCRPSG